MKLVIANKNYSSWSLRAWIGLRAVGQPFEEVRVLLDQADTQERILAHSPSGKVPCLIDGPLVVWDSLAIIETMAERFPQLWPATSTQRAHARAVCAEMHSGFAALRSQMPMNIRRSLPGRGRTPASEADIARIIAIWLDCRRRYAKQGPYLFGAFSAADAMFAPVCFRFMSYGVEPTGEAGAYLATMLAHPAMREWQAGALAETEIVPSDELPA
ncbi:glutathione S-transferase family protein [Niveibacterium sp. 24ML]|uniref:glutathione S-transferase family protein n=1 Tax=Niveibacterium sp. 24ML TaxID=2985512 RepID=UPI00226EAC47|nr:glutathione S-transferase family protein [Niveibacterium sp. 24ML]MCX9157511.1 glutathione S-transferase family protein [Niveibacterium sp. 24ML]